VNLPKPAKAVVTGTVVAAAAVLILGVLGWFSPHGRALSFGPGWLTCLIGAMVAAGWARPLLVYRRGNCESVQFDEGLLFIAVLLLPAQGVLAAFSGGVIVGQLVRQRNPVKVAFNVAQAICCTGAGVAVADLWGRLPLNALRPVGLLAGAFAAVAFFLTSNLFLAAIMRTAEKISVTMALLREKADLRFASLGAGLVMGAVAGPAVVGRPWAVPLIPVAFVSLRFAVAGHLGSRVEGDRVRGLLEATLGVQSSVFEEEIRDGLTAAAARVLWCSTAKLTMDPAGDGELGIPVSGNEQLVVGRRYRNLRFNRTDRQLLDALAAVGRTALAHARLYAQSRRHEEQLSAIMRSLAEGVVAFDETGKPVFVNPAAEDLLGLSAEEISACGTSLAAAESLAPLSAIARRCLRSGRPVHDDSGTFDRARGGSLAVSYNCTPITEQGAAVGAVLAFRDITDRIAAEQELAFSAFHDQLTCLPNRRLFLERLEHALRRSQRSGTMHAVLFADVDRFKLINDNLGHAAGDELLCEIAHRLAELMRPADSVARFGGDEFTVLLEDVEGPHTGQAMAERIQAAMRPPVRLHDGREIVATLSVGIATTTGQQLADDVLHDADVAMYQAKTLGIGGVHVYDAAAMQARSAQRLDIEADLRTALVEDRLEVFYQPLVDVVTGAVADVEALVRWRHPDGLRLPGEFIPVAEETGLILSLGRQVLAKAAQQAEEWHMGGAAVGVAVNLSARQFCDPMLVAELYRALESSGLPPERLCLEITESLAMREVEETIQTLRRMKELGVRLAIDDFGTGYSSLSYLKRFPIDVVKIDQSFVREIHTSEMDRAIVEAIVRLCDTMGVVTVAEGVEGAHQLVMLRDVGCRLAQGYHLCRPRPAAEIGPLLERPVVPAQRRRGGGKVTHLFAG
jgi:diguanylate cyclase (GGDEF)-like protein/PAS domain S-box-containing protein